MDEKQVNIIRLQLAQTLINTLGGFFFARIGNPDFGHQEDVFSAYAGLGDGITDTFFVIIGLRRIDESVSHLECIGGTSFGLLRGHFEQPISQEGHLDAIVQLNRVHNTNVGKKRDWLVASAVAESAGTALGLTEFRHFHHFGLLVTRDDHLCNALTGFDSEGFTGEVHEDDSHFATIVGINGSGRVQNSNTMLHSKTAARTYLGLVAGRQLQKESGGEEFSLQRLQRDGFVNTGTQIHPCCLSALVFRQRIIRLVYNLYYHGFN